MLQSLARSANMRCMKLQFSLATLLLIVAVVAIACGGVVAFGHLAAWCFGVNQFTLFAAIEMLGIRRPNSLRARPISAY